MAVDHVARENLVLHPLATDSHDLDSLLRPNETHAHPVAHPSSSRMCAQYKKAQMPGNNSSSARKKCFSSGFTFRYQTLFSLFPVRHFNWTCWGRKLWSLSKWCFSLLSAHASCVSHPTAYGAVCEHCKHKPWSNPSTHSLVSGLALVSARLSLWTTKA